MKSCRMPLSASVKPSMSVKPSVSVKFTLMYRLVEGPVVQELLPSGLEGLDSPRD